MIPHFKLVDRDGKNPLRRNDRHRPLRILIDPLLRPGPSQNGATLFDEFVKSVAKSPHIDIVTFQTAEDEKLSESHVKTVAAGEDTIEAVFTSGDMSTRNFVTYESNIQKRSDYEASRGAKINAFKWRDALLVSRVAEAIEADILVTSRRSTLLTPEEPAQSPAYCLSERDCMAIGASVLRHQEAWTNTWPMRIEYSRAEWLARRTIILDRVFRHDRSLTKFRAIGALIGDSYMGDRGESILQRLSTAVSIRDIIAVEAMKPVNNEGADRTSAHIEWLCLTISGAFDSLALMANSMFPTPCPNKAVSWTESRWRRALRYYLPDYFDVISHTSAVATLKLCKRLRDTIHSIPPDSTFYSGPDTDGDVTRIVVPREKATGFSASCISAGGRAQDWGVSEFGDLILVDPTTCSNRLLESALECFRVAIDGFPWNQFPNLPLPEPENQRVTEVYAEGLDYMYTSYGLTQ